MAENKTAPTAVPVDDFLAGVPERRQVEARRLIEIMGGITGEPAVMWGPSIVGFGTYHYTYASGREGDSPLLAFSPRTARLTIYFDGFDRYADQFGRLGKHSTSVACLYVNKLADVDLDVLTEMLELCHQAHRPG